MYKEILNFLWEISLQSLSRMVIFAVPIPTMVSPSSLPMLRLTRNHSLASAIVSSTRETGKEATEGPPAGRVRVSNVDTTTSMPTEERGREGGGTKINFNQKMDYNIIFTQDGAKYF